VPDKRLSAKKSLPTGFLPMTLCRELRSAKALPRILEALLRPGALGKAASSGSARPCFFLSRNLDRDEVARIYILTTKQPGERSLRSCVCVSFVVSVGGKEPKRLHI
jgi:hypothetical protein